MRVIKELHGDSKLKEMIYNMELKEVEDKDFKQIKIKDVLDIERINKSDSEFLTCMEAKRECMRIELKFCESVSKTPKLIEKRAKEELILGLKRKYTN